MTRAAPLKMYIMIQSAVGLVLLNGPILRKVAIAIKYTALKSTSDEIRIDYKSENTLESVERCCQVIKAVGDCIQCPFFVAGFFSLI